MTKKAPQGLVSREGKSKNFVSLGRKKEGKEPFFKTFSKEPLLAGALSEPGNNGGFHNYYSTFEGFLHGLVIREREIPHDDGTKHVHERLYLLMTAGGIDYEVEVGDYDSRYALSALKRLAHDECNLKDFIRLWPYRIEDSEGVSMGIAIHQFGESRDDVKKIPFVSKEWQEEHETTVVEEALFKGKVHYDFSGHAEWFFEYVKNRLMDSFEKEDEEEFGSDAIQHDPLPPSVNRPSKPVVPDQISDDPFVDDDLPF